MERVRDSLSFTKKTHIGFFIKATQCLHARVKARKGHYFKKLNYASSYNKVLSPRQHNYTKVRNNKKRLFHYKEAEQRDKEQPGGGKGQKRARLSYGVSAPPLILDRSSPRSLPCLTTTCKRIINIGRRRSSIMNASPPRATIISFGK